MKDTKAERLAEALNHFLETSPNAEAAAVVSFDGLTMASALPADIDEERMGAMSAALLGLGEQAALGLGRGELNQIFVEGDEGFVFLMSARDQAVLAVVTDHDAKIGFVLYEMRHAAAVIGSTLLGDDVEVGQEAGAAPAQSSIDELPEDDFEVYSGYDDPVAELSERDADSRIEHEIVWPPADAGPYEPGPIPDDLQQNPYYLVSKAPEPARSEPAE